MRHPFLLPEHSPLMEVLLPQLQYDSSGFSFPSLMPPSPQPLTHVSSGVLPSEFHSQPCSRSFSSSHLFLYLQLYPYVFKTQPLSQLTAESQSHVNSLLDTPLCSPQAPQIQHAKKGNSLYLARGCSSSEFPISVNDNTAQ